MPQEQLPSNPDDQKLLRLLYERYSAAPHDFEYCAAAVARILLPQIVSVDVTRPSRDGGRDAVGQLRLGEHRGAVHVEFALEAKCYREDNAVGVRDIARLVSRLRHRQFGIFVTTSFVGEQAYRELAADGHPVVVVSGGDLVALLKRSGVSDERALGLWLETLGSHASRQKGVPGTVFR